MKYATLEYRRLHKWVQRQLGEPSECVDCGKSEEGIYHWANISGEYKQDLSDWERLCPRCHKRKDMKGRHRPLIKECLRGHELSGDNIRWRTRGEHTWRVCRKCVSVYSAQHNQRKKELQYV